jgi:hypothetical protein
MSRPLRIEYDGAVYYVMSRGNEKKSVFRTAIDLQNFLIQGNAFLFEEGLCDCPPSGVMQPDVRLSICYF